MEKQNPMTSEVFKTSEVFSKSPQQMRSDEGLLNPLQHSSVATARLQIRKSATSKLCTGRVPLTTIECCSYFATIQCCKDYSFTNLTNYNFL